MIFATKSLILTLTLSTQLWPLLLQLRTLIKVSWIGCINIIYFVLVLVQQPSWFSSSITSLVKLHTTGNMNTCIHKLWQNMIVDKLLTTSIANCSCTQTHNTNSMYSPNSWWPGVAPGNDRGCQTACQQTIVVPYQPKCMTSYIHIHTYIHTYIQHQHNAAYLMYRN